MYAQHVVFGHLVSIIMYRILTCTHMEYKAELTSGHLVTQQRVSPYCR